MKTLLFASLLGFSTFLACGEQEKADFEGDNPDECSDGVDNDQDGEYDCNDQDCEGSPDCESTNDADGDGFDDINAGGDDCDDNNPNIHPMAGDTYGDGVDSDCDGLDCEAASDGNTYFAACKVNYSWAESKIACVEAGYDGLASLLNVTEEAFAYTLMSSPLEYWIGLNELSEEDSWIWDSTGTNVDYANWGPGEPQDLYGDEDCVMVNTDSWVDLDCSSSNKFFCEKR